MNRREFIKVGVGSLAAITVGQLRIPSIFDSNAYAAPQQTINLSITEALVEMVDLVQVYMWTFADQNGPHFPGPVIFAREGEVIRLNVTNHLTQDHAFAVPGTTIKTGIIHPGQTKRIYFTAPKAGTYLYVDPMNPPVNRMLGLHGAMVTLPRSGNSPYTRPTSEVQQLFNDLGTTARFPGNPWDPARTFIWLFHQIDPFLNNFMQNNPPISPTTFVRSFLPRYFTINGKTGFFASHDDHIAPHGRVGEPALLRVLNAGLVFHSPHIHGNHVYQLAINGSTQNNIFLLDTWTMRPLDRRDVLLPFVKPPDIPPAAWPPVEESFPLVYPMHCHMEMSQTSGGGNYPQGLITDWVIEGPLEGPL